jgi:prepilin-type N-terminal cleavage/methylation domain-containing protein
MTPRSERNRSQAGAVTRGFTLMEVLIVVVVAGILLSIALPSFDLTRYRADAVVQNVRSVLQAAQRASLVKQHDVLVSFDTVRHRTRIAWDANNDGVINGGERFTWKAIESPNRFARPGAGVSGSVTAAIVGVNVRVLDSLPTVTFRRDGSLSSNLEVYTSTTGRNAALEWRAIQLVQATGRADWFRWSASANRWVAGAL